MFFDVPFILLNISLFIIIAMFFVILNMKGKEHIHYVFIALMISVFIWTFGYVGLYYINKIFKYNSTFFIYLTSTGTIITPLALYYLGYTFAHTRINFLKRSILLLIIPMISMGLLYTNKYHHLFYKYFSAENITYRVFGVWNTVHVIYSYILILVGLWYLLYFSIKNSGFFSRQSKLIIIGIIVPLVINMLITFQIGNLPYYTESIAFTFGLIFFALAIFKFQFLNVVPVALQRIVDLMSDAYIVVNEHYEIIDYNKTCTDTFKDILRIKRKENFIELIDSVNFLESREFIAYNETATQQKRTVAFEKHIELDSFDKHFTIEVTPIFTREDYIGTIYLMKDITEHKQNIETIKRNQEILMEQERLASLGQLIGGIAHNLKTPIMSIAGAIEGISELVEEYEDSIDDEEVTVQDHKEIAQEMHDWLNKMKPYCAYMSDVISAVKGQAVQLNTSLNYGFTLDEFVKRIQILMKHELIKGNCTLNVHSTIDFETILKGDINSLVQVFNNIIANAIQAYENENGIIDLYIDKDREREEILFTITDYASGISEDIKNKLLKEMITTKGTKGTGLGLYMSYSTIKGRFSGEMWFDSNEENGTSFYISIPCSRNLEG